VIKHFLLHLAVNQLKYCYSNRLIEATVRLLPLKCSGDHLVFGLNPSYGIPKSTKQRFGNKMFPSSSEGRDTCYNGPNTHLRKEIDLVLLCFLITADEEDAEKPSNAEQICSWHTGRERGHELT
jgi:hypothetical protein